MNTSEKISRVIGVLQEHERLHSPIRDLLRQHTGAGFQVARAGMSPAEKWATLEVLRRDLLAALCLLAFEGGIELPEYLCRACKGVNDATS